MHDRRHNDNVKPPVEVGDEIDVRIEAVGDKGDGVAKRKGFVLFVPNTSVGQEKRVRITRVLQKMAFAEVIGDAEGPIEVEQKPARRPPQKTNLPEPEPEPEYEDTEDFGEDDSEALH